MEFPDGVVREGHERKYDVFVYFLVFLKHTVLYALI